MQLGGYYIERRTAALIGVLVLVVIGAVLKFTVFNGSSSSSASGTIPAVTTPTGTAPTTPSQTTTSQTTTGQTTPTTTPGRTGTTGAQTTPVLPGRPTRTVIPKGINGVVQGQVYVSHCTGKGKSLKCKAAPLARATVLLRGLRPPTRNKTLRTKTDARGFYQIQVKPGFYQITVSGHQGPLAQANVFPHQLFYAPPIVVRR